MMHVLSFLPPNDLACSGRAAFKEAWLQLREPHQCTASMRQPLPPHVAVEWPAWAQPAQEALRQLPFNLKVRLLSTAASSGCETNLAVAWALVRPCLFPDANVYLGLFKDHPVGCMDRGPVDVLDPGTAAARAGHPELIPWLVRHGCPVDVQAAVTEVAKRCSLGQLQEAVAFVQAREGESAANYYCEWALFGAAACREHEGALAKVEWLHGVAGTGLRPYIVDAAAAAGNLRLLQWLRGKGCQVGTRSVLAAALEGADLGVARWLVEEAGVQLPASRSPDSQQSDRMEGSWASLCGAAAASGDVAKLRWLQVWGGTLHKGALIAAAKGGHLDVVRYLHEECGQQLMYGQGLSLYAAVSYDSIEVVQYLLRRDPCLREYIFTELYTAAAEHGNVQMIQRFLQEPQDLGTVLGGGRADGIVDSWGFCGRPMRGCIEVVKSIQECGVVAPFSCGLLGAAASKGDLPLVRYLHEEQRIPFGANTLARAAEGGCEALLEWLLAEGCPVPGPDNGDKYRTPRISSLTILIPLPF